MAKRGETRPWRLSYDWTDRGISGVNAYRTEEQANSKADEMLSYAARIGRKITVKVAHR